MNYGGIAALIAALAFAALVGGILLTLIKIPKLIAEIQTTIQRINTTIDVVTKDVDGLSLEVETLLHKTNSLMDDVNRKVGKIDPLFDAVGDLGETVSEINVSAKNSATNFISGLGKKKPGKLSKLRRGVSRVQKVKNFVTPDQAETVTVVEEGTEAPTSSPDVTVETITINKGEMTNG